MFPIQNEHKIIMNSTTSAIRQNPSASECFSDILSEKSSISEYMDSIFQKASAQYDVPANLLKAVAKAESNFNPKAVSGSGAAGVMQLMPKTAEYLGVKDIFDAEQNIMGGAKYLSELIKKYDGNTALALAAYNAGSGNVAKYGGIPPFNETKNYISKVMSYTKEGMDTSYFSATNSSSDISNKTAENIYNFNDFSNENCLLFIENLKLEMSNALHKDYSNELLVSRVKINYL